MQVQIRLGTAPVAYARLFRPGLRNFPSRPVPCIRIFGSCEQPSSVSHTQKSQKRGLIEAQSEVNCRVFCFARNDARPCHPLPSCVPRTSTSLHTRSRPRSISVSPYALRIRTSAIAAKAILNPRIARTWFQRHSSFPTSPQRSFFPCSFSGSPDPNRSQMPLHRPNGRL